MGEGKANLPNWITIAESNIDTSQQVVSINNSDLSTAEVARPFAICAVTIRTTLGTTAGFNCLGFFVTLVHPCELTSLQPPTSLIAGFEILIGNSRDLQLEFLNDDYNANLGSTIAPSACGAQEVTFTHPSYTGSVVFASVTAAVATSEQDTLTISTSTGDSDVAGKQILKVRWALTGYPTVYYERDLEINFVELVTPTHADMKYSIFGATVVGDYYIDPCTMLVPGFTDGFTISHAPVSTHSWLTQSDAQGAPLVFQIESTDYQDAGTHNVSWSCTATEIDDPYSSLTKYFDITVVMTDECATAVLSVADLLVDDMTVILGNSGTPPTVAVQAARNDGRGNQCGPQTVTINDGMAAGSEFSTYAASTGLISIASTDTTLVEIIQSITVTWSLDNYQDTDYPITQDELVNVNFIELTQFADMDYTVTDTSINAQMDDVFWDSAYCNGISAPSHCIMIVSPSSGADIMALDATTGVWSISQVLDNAYAGIYTVTINGELNSQAISTSWQLTIFEHLCTEYVDVVTLAATPILDQYYNAESDQILLDVNVFTEDCDYCASTDIVYTYTVVASGSQDTSFITMDAQARQITWYTGEASSVGTYSIELTGTLTTNTLNEPRVVSQTITFVLTVDEALLACETTSLTIQEVEDQENLYKYTYETGTYMSPVRYEIIRDPPDALCEGTILLTVNSQTDLDDIEDQYGITVTQTTSADGTRTWLSLNSLYGESDLDGQVLTIQLAYYISDSVLISFDTIEVSYVAPAVLNVNPYLVTMLPEPAVIPCLTDGAALVWSYQIPEAASDLGNDVTYGFSSTFLADLLIFDSTTKQLRLNLDHQTPTVSDNSTETTVDDIFSSIKTKAALFGEYSSTLMLLDNQGNTQEYSIIFNLTCVESSSSSESSSLDGGFVATEIPIEEEDWYKEAKYDAWLGGYAWVEPVEPKPQFWGVDEYGVIKLLWNTEMRTDFKRYGDNLRRLQEKEIDGSYSDLLNVELLQGSEEELVPSQMLDYTYELEWYNSTLQMVSLDFKAPEYVSQSTEENDKLRITFNDTSAFSSKDYPQLQVTQDLNMTIDLPRQLPYNGVLINVIAMKTTSRVAVNAGFVISFFFSFLLNQILSFVENLCVIIHMFIFNMSYPVNLQKFMAGLFPLIIFDAVPTDDLYDYMMSMSDYDDSPMRDSEQFESVGYEASLTVTNMGSMFILMVATPVFMILAWTLSWSCFKACGKPGKWFNSKGQGYLDSMFFNGIIGSIDAGYLVLTITALIQIHYPRLGPAYSVTENFCTIMGIIIFAINLSFPFVVSILYCCKLKRGDPVPDLEDTMQLEELRQNYSTINIQEIQREAYTISKHKMFMERYGKLLEEIDTVRMGKKLSIATVIIYIVRKLAVAVSVVVVEHPVFNIFMFNFSSLFVLMWIIYLEPFADSTFQKTRVMQELVIMGINYHLFCFTDWVDISRRTGIGNSCIYIIMIQTVVFLVWALIPLFVKCQVTLRRKKMRKKAKVAAKLKEKQKEEQATLNVTQFQQTDKKMIVNQDAAIFAESGLPKPKQDLDFTRAEVPSVATIDMSMHAPLAELPSIELEDPQTSGKAADLVEDMPLEEQSQPDDSQTSSKVVGAFEDIQDLGSENVIGRQSLIEQADDYVTKPTAKGKVFVLPKKLEKEHRSSRQDQSVMQASLNTISEVGSFRENDPGESLNRSKQLKGLTVVEKLDYLENSQQLSIGLNEKKNTIFNKLDQLESDYGFTPNLRK